jgi:APA family basic amino acid/polyamine antiporter
MANLFVRKPIADLLAEAGTAEMPRVLGAGHLTALGVGAVVGAGIFVLTGQAAAAHAGPAIALSFVLAGFVCALAGLCYAELAAAVPASGSAYSYAYATMGELVAWVIGWDLVLEYALSATTVAIGWSGYAVSALRGLGIDMPPHITAAPGTRVIYIPEAVARELHLLAWMPTEGEKPNRILDSLRFLGRAHRSGVALWVHPDTGSHLVSPPIDLRRSFRPPRSPRISRDRTTWA